MVRLILRIFERASRSRQAFITQIQTLYNIHVAQVACNVQEQLIIWQLRSILNAKRCTFTSRLNSMHFVCHTMPVAWFIQSSHTVHKFTFQFLLMRRCYFNRRCSLSRDWRRTSTIDYWWIESEVIHFVASTI